MKKPPKKPPEPDLDENEAVIQCGRQFGICVMDGDFALEIYGVPTGFALIQKAGGRTLEIHFEEPTSLDYPANPSSATNANTDGKGTGSK